MTAAPAAGAADAPALALVVEGAAQRSGAWVLLEAAGRVTCHGAGRGSCPTPLVESLLHKTTHPLRAATRWHRGAGLLRGRAGEADVIAADLGEGRSLWFVTMPPGPGPQDAVALVEAVRSALAAHVAPVTDPVVADMLTPRGSLRRSRPHAAALAVLRGPAPLPAVAAAAVRAGVMGGHRVHTLPDAVVVALAHDADPGQLVARVRGEQPAVTAGVAPVAEGAADWTEAADLADRCQRAAARLGLPLGGPDDPRVAAQVLLDEARQAVAALEERLPGSPLRRVREHDSRSSGALATTLHAWSRCGFEAGPTAEVLHVHVNTLRYRLRRAAEVAGLDLADGSSLALLGLLPDPAPREGAVAT